MTVESSGIGIGIRDRESKTSEALKAGERVRCCCCWEGLCTLLPLCPMALMGDDDQRGWMMVGQWGLLTFLLSVPCVLLYLHIVAIFVLCKKTDFIIRLFEYKDSETKWLCCCCCYVYCESEEFSVLGCLDGAREIRIGSVRSASNHHLGESVLV